MIVDHRTYTLKPNRVAEYLEVFEQYGLPVQVRHLGEPIGYFVTTIGTVNQVVHLWGYKNLADMEQRRIARDADADWGPYKSMTQDLVVLQENKILAPTSFSRIK